MDEDGVGPTASRRRPLLPLAVGAALAVSLVAGGAIVLSTGSDPDVRPTPAALPPVHPPAGVEAETGIAPFQVTLTWSEPAGGAEVTKYEVFQGSQQVGSLGPTSLSLTDHAVEPGNTYTYSLVAFSGDRSSEPVTVQVELPVPPLSEARVHGRYEASVKATSHSGFSRFRGRGKFDVQMEGDCRWGACDTIVLISAKDEIDFRLHRKGARYQGSGSGQFDVLCGRTVMVSRLEMTLRVTKGAASLYFGVASREWVASELRGTLTQVQNPQLGCSGSEAEFEITLSRSS